MPPGKTLVCLFVYVYLSEKLDYEKSIESHLEMINQQNNEIETLRGTTRLD